MPDTSRNSDGDEWEVTPVKSRRKKESNGAKKGGGRPGKNNSGGRGGGFRSGWAKPVTLTKNTKAVQDGAPDKHELSQHPVPVKAANTIGDGAAPEAAAQGGFTMMSMSALLADYGEYDPNWMDKQPDIIETQQECSENRSIKAVSDRLGQQGKAPLHIDVVSFGFKYGAPPTRRDGWSQTQPLQPFDCRDILPPVPGYLQFHDGLSSGQVKRFLLYEYRRYLHKQQQQQQKRSSASEQDVDDGEKDESPPSVREYSSDTVAPQIYQALLEAVHTEDYGYALPLKMQIFIGSEWGRHRSVVAAEQTATALRRLLRNSKDGDGLTCPCSVATQHRDIDRKIPSKKNDRDED